MTDIKEKIAQILKAEMITIGVSVEDAKTGQMWAYDSERLTNRLVSLLTDEGMVILDKDQELPIILIEPEWTKPETIRQFKKLLADFKRVRELK